MQPAPRPGVRGLVVVVLVLLVLLGMTAPAGAQETVDDVIPPDSQWYSLDDAGTVSIDLWFYWSPTCPHCRKAEPWIEDLAAGNDWLTLHSLLLTEDENVEVAVAMREEIEAFTWGGEVPAFFACESFDVGFGSVETTGTDLEAKWRACQEDLQARVDVALAAAASGSSSPVEPDSGEAAETTPPMPLPADDPDEESVRLPLIGEISSASVSLPVFTVAIASVDAFNPCAFFVLLALLSVLVHAASRWKMATIGGVFVLVSGIAYFVFMAGLLTLFGVIENQRIITIVGGAVALVIAAFAIKDYFWFKQGPTLSIPEGAKPGLFRRMRGLTQSASLPTLLIGAVTLAVVANMYELLCTAGFPTVYNSVLLNAELTDPQRYGYLVFYNVIYVVPLAAIVGVFVWTLGSRKLSEREGRVLKLLSGTMMLLLGAALLFRPAILGNATVGIALLLLAAIATAVVVLVDRRLHPADPPPKRRPPKKRPARSH